jgi:hypothetical protein
MYRFNFLLFYFVFLIETLAHAVILLDKSFHRIPLRSKSQYRHLIENTYNWPGTMPAKIIFSINKMFSHLTEFGLIKLPCTVLNNWPNIFNQIKHLRSLPSASAIASDLRKTKPSFKAISPTSGWSTAQSSDFEVTR